MEYTRVNHLKALFVSLDDTDHYGHKGDYKSYIQAIQAFDHYLQEIWTLIETDEFYKGHTYMIVTTDHGRGATADTWSKHGFFALKMRRDLVIGVWSGHQTYRGSIRGDATMAIGYSHSDSLQL